MSKTKQKKSQEKYDNSLTWKVATALITVATWRTSNPSGPGAVINQLLKTTAQCYLAELMIKAVSGENKFLAPKTRIFLVSLGAGVASYLKQPTLDTKDNMGLNQ